MPLKLSVPAIDESLLPAETRPKKLEEMVLSLPIGDLAETADQLCEALMPQNRQELGAENRLKLLEILRPAVFNAIHGLAAEYCGIALPLPDKAKDAADMASKLATELAYGYKQAILDQESKLFSFGSRKQLAAPIQRAIHALSRVLLISYQTYSAPPAGVWAEIHQLYLHALQESLQDIKFDDGGKMTSISLTYKQALLMALADPGRLTAIDIERLSEYLERYAGHAQIQPLGKPESPAGIFLIRLKSDKAAIPFGIVEEVLDLRTDILLITIDLARLLHNQIGMLQAGEPPKNLGLPDYATDYRYQDMLADLLKHCGNPPKRMFNRLNKSDVINVAIGIAATQYFLNGGVPYQVASSQETGEAAAPDRNKDKTYSSARWQVVNESAGGLAISNHPSVQISIRVGELLGLKTDKAGNWSIGVVRRVSNNSDNSLEVGAQMLAPSAKAAAVRIVDKDRFEMALTLPELPALKQPPSIIAPRGIYQPARVLDLDENGTVTRILATRLVERTSSFERFQYSVL